MNPWPPTPRAVTPESAGAPRVLVIGARGRFGAAAVQAFAAAGWRVLAQVRRLPDGPSPAGVQWMDTPLDDTAALAGRAAGVRAVVYAANPPYTAWAREAMPMLRQALDITERLGATFLFPGNVYAYGASMPPRLAADTPAHPDTRKGRIRQAMEAEIEDRTRRGLRAVVVRAGDFFGQGQGSWLDLVIAKDLRRGRLSYPGPLDQPHAWAYLPDLARAFVAVAGRDEGPAWQVLPFEGHTLTGAGLLDAIEAAVASLGAVPEGGLRRSRMPWWPLRLAAPFWPMGRELLEVAYLWRVPHALDGSALRAAVGPLPATPIDRAMTEALRDLGLAAEPGRTQSMAG